MLREISDSRYIDIPGSNRYSIVMQPDELRADAMRSFLKGLDYLLGVKELTYDIASLGRYQRLTVLTQMGCDA